LQDADGVEVYARRGAAARPPGGGRHIVKTIADETDILETGRNTWKKFSMIRGSAAPA
jgi:hypothetical protein